MNDPAHNEWHRLFSAALNGTITEAEKTQLATLLKTSAEARQLWFLYHDNECGLAELKPRYMATSTGQLPRTRLAWLTWRPLTAAVAGLMFGMFCTSVVFAYVVPLARSMTLLDDGFEGTPTLVSKVSLEPGVWRGDHAEVVGTERDMMPESGQRMLRFLRADFQGKPRAIGGHIADVYRLIDLREYRHEFIGGGAVVQASARVNATPFPENEKFGCAISIFAFDEESLPDSASYIGTALENDANAMVRSSRTKLDRDPSSWQRLNTEMRLPANTEFLVVRLHINQLFASDGSSVFTGSYADEVRVILTQRTPLP